MEDIERWAKQFSLELAALRKQADNSRCFECCAEGPQWASANLGVFICTECSDVHRGCGTHISKVKNFSTYLWGPDEVELMKSIGNKRGRVLYGDATIQPGMSKQDKVIKCTSKYGSSRVRELVGEHVRAACLKGTEFANGTAQTSRPPAPTPQFVCPAIASFISPAVVTNISAAAVIAMTPKPVSSPLSEDWLEAFFCEDKQQVPVRCSKDAVSIVGIIPVRCSKEPSLDTFLASCLGAAPQQAVFVPQAPRAVAVVGPSDGSLWTDFGDW